MIAASHYVTTNTVFSGANIDFFKQNIRKIVQSCFAVVFQAK